jgi:hypothetical protein
MNSNQSKFSEISVEDLNLFVKSFNSMSNQKISSMNSATKQKVEQFIDIIMKYADFPIAYSIIYTNVMNAWNKKSVDPGTIGSFMWGSLLENRIEYIGDAKEELLRYVVNAYDNNPNPCSLLGAGSLSKDTAYCTVPVIYYDGIELTPLFSKQREAISSSLYGITPRTFKNLNFSSDKSERTHRDDGILYLPIYKNDDSNITSISTINKKYAVPSIDYNMISQLLDYGINDVAVFLYHKGCNKKDNYTVYYSGKYNLNRKKSVEIQLPSEFINNTLENPNKCGTGIRMKSKVKNLTAHIGVVLVIGIIILYLLSKGFSYL